VPILGWKESSCRDSSESSPSAAADGFEFFDESVPKELSDFRLGKAQMSRRGQAKVAPHFSVVRVPTIRPSRKRR